MEGGERRYCVYRWFEVTATGRTPGAVHPTLTGGLAKQKRILRAGWSDAVSRRLWLRLWPGVSRHARQTLVVAHRFHPLVHPIDVHRGRLR